MKTDKKGMQIQRHARHTAMSHGQFGNQGGPRGSEDEGDIEICLPPMFAEM